MAADQLTKFVVSSALTIDNGVAVLGPLSIRHVRNSGIAFGLFASRTSAVILLTAFAVAAMVVFYARSAPAASVSAGRARARARRQHLESRRPRPARLRHGLHRLPLVAGVQPRRQLHRRRRRTPLPLVRRGRPNEPARWRRSAFTSLRRRRASGSTAFSRRARDRLARARRAADRRRRARSTACARAEELPAGRGAGGRVRTRRAASRSSPRRSTFPSRGRTSTCSSSTSRLEWSSTRPGRRDRARSYGLLALGAEGGEEDRPGIVHRLDRDTSGLMLVARSEQAHAALQRLISATRGRADAISRSYAADRAPGRVGSTLRSGATGVTARATRSTRRRRALPPPGSSSGGSSAHGRCSSCVSRPGAHTRSASISRRSVCPSAEIRCTGCPISASSGNSCTRTACGSSTAHGRAARHLVAAARRSRGRARARSRRRGVATLPAALSLRTGDQLERGCRGPSSLQWARFRLAPAGATQLNQPERG